MLHSVSRLGSGLVAVLWVSPSVRPGGGLLALLSASSSSRLALAVLLLALPPPVPAQQGEAAERSNKARTLRSCQLG